MIHHPAPFGKPQFLLNLNFKKRRYAIMSKEITKMSRLAGQLERMFNALNRDFYNGELETPTITVQNTPRAYGHVSTWDAWSVKGNGRKELNVGAGTLNRPLEATVSTILHEMAHLYSMDVLNVQDTSRGGTYHNKFFKKTAESHGLICARSEKYGWSDTSTTLSDELVEWVLLHDEFREIELCRTTPGLSAVGVGTRAADGSTIITPGTSKSNSRRFVCPKCGMIARTTRAARLICGDCMAVMEER